MDDAVLDLILQGAGIDPGSVQGQAYKAALRRQSEALASTSGEDTRRWDLGFEREGDQYERNLQFKQDELDQQYELAKLSARTAEERLALDRWKAERDNELAQQRLALDSRRVDIEQGGQGLDLLRQTVELGQQPRSWTAALDWRRGVAANPFAVGSINRLLTNTGASAGSNAPTMTAPQGLPEANSLQGVLASLGVGQAASDQTNAAMSAGGAATQQAGQPKPDPSPAAIGIQAIAKQYQPSDQDGYDAKDIATLRSIAALASQGSHRTANRVAQMDEDEQQVLAGGLDRLGIGGDWWLRDAERKRVGQSGSGRAY